MATELPRPGVEVIQVFRSTSPTVVTPTLVPVIVGVCKQIVEVLVPADGGGNELNTGALISLPALLVAAAAAGNPAAYGGLDGKSAVLSVNHGPDVTVEFEGASLTPASVVAQFAEQFLEQGVTEMAPETLGDDAFRLKTIGVGEFQSIEVRPGTDNEVLSAFGWTIGYVFVGTAAYDQDFLEVPQASFPDPRGNLDELAIESSSIRAFLGLGGGLNLRELQRTQSYLRQGGAPTAAALTGTVALSGLTYSTVPAVTGNTDATAAGLYGGGGSLNGLTIILTVNGVQSTLTLNGGTNTANQAALLAAIHTQWPSITASINSTNLRLTGSLGDVFSVGAGTANSALGITGLTGNGAGSVDGKTLLVSLDDGAAITVTFGTPKAANELVQQFNDGLGGVYGSVNTGLKITSKLKGTSSGVAVTGGTAVVALGFSVPNDSATGTAGVRVVDDGNGDAVSPLVEVPGTSFTDSGTAAVAKGLVDLSTLTLPGDLDGKTLRLSITGRDPQTLTFVAPANPSAVVTQINNFWDGLVTASLDGGNHLVLTTDQLGEEGVIKVLEGTALELLGLVPSVTSLRLTTDVSPDFTALNGKKFRLDLNGTLVEHTFSGFTNVSTANDVATALNGTLGTDAEAEVVSTRFRVRLTGKAGTLGAYIRVAAASSAEAAFILGFDVNQRGDFFRFSGGGFAPISGDDFYVDGNLVGRITQVAPGGNSARVRLDKQLPITASLGSVYTIWAKNLSVGSSTRPSPELVVDLQGDPQVKHDLLRDTVGNPIEGKAPVYISYSAVRRDVSPKKKTPGLLKVDNTDQLAALLAPVNVDNPLALGLQFALQNAPGCQVQALGVDTVSPDAPYGTVEAFTRAAEYLEAAEVYAIAPLTHDETVAQVFNTHVSAMSAPAAKGERICVFNFSRPAKKLDALVASGLNGNSVGSTGKVLDTGVVSLPSLVLSAGINPVGTIPTSAGLFLDIASDNKRYSIASLSGGQVTIRTTFAAGENDDGFYATTDLNDPPLPSSLIDEPFAVRVRGAALANPDGSPDKQGIAETYQGIAKTYLNRRFWSVVPDKAAATLNGLEQEVEGFYMCAAIAGMIGQQPPQQSFTNFPMTGFTKVIGSNGYFTEKQLNIIAAGGNYIVVQDTEGAPLTSRMALTTDVTSIETRTDSVTKVVDFTAKFMRAGLKNYIGRFNITQGFLDSLGHVVQGLLQFLTDIGVLIGATMNNIVQDENAPDTVLIDVTLDVPFPCNYIRLTLVI